MIRETQVNGRWYKIETLTDGRYEIESIHEKVSHPFLVAHIRPKNSSILFLKITQGSKGCLYQVKEDMDALFDVLAFDEREDVSNEMKSNFNTLRNF